MTFIKDLKRLRGAAAAGNVLGVDQAPKPDGQVQPPAAKEPELRGGQGKPVAKKAQGLSGAALRTTIGDLFGAAERLGIPGAMIAKYAAGMDQSVASMKDSAARIEKVVAELEEPAKTLSAGLPAQLVLAISRGFSGMDQTSAGQQIRKTIEAAVTILEGPRKLTGAHTRALEQLAQAAGQLNNGDLAQELDRGAKSVLGKNDEVAVHAGLAELNASMPTFVAGSEGGARTSMFRAALEAGLFAAHEAERPAADVVELAVQQARFQPSDGQRQMLAEYVDRVRARKQEAAQLRADAEAQVEGLRGQYQQQLDGPSAEKLAPLANERAHADAALSPQELALWYGQVNAFVGHDAAAVAAIARVQLAMLEHGGGGVPPAEVVGQVSQTLVALAATPGLTPEMMQRFAEDHVRAQPAERTPGMIAVLTGLLQRLGEVTLKEPGDLAALANGLIGRTDAFADQARSDLLASLIQGTAEGAPRAAALEHGARLTQAVHAMEPGGARDTVIARLSEDVTATVNAGLDFAALASAYRLVPEEMIPRFVNTAIAHGIDPDAWLDKLSNMFKAARGNKEHVRSIRTLVTLAEQAGADVPKLVDLLLAAKMNGPQLTRTVNALLNENNHEVTKEQIDRAIGMLERGESIAGAIEAKLHADMVAKLGLNALLQDANIKVTQYGFELVSNSLRQFFSSGLQNAQLDKEMFKRLLISVLEDRFDGFRFTTAPADTQLGSLTSTQRRLWEEGVTMTHVRFQGEGQAEFDKRVTAAAAIAGGLLERMTAAWGNLGELRAKHGELVTQLRQVDKNDLDARRALVGQIGSLPAKLEALEWATELAGMTPQTTTPLRFARLGDRIPGLTRLLGESGAAAMNELAWTVRIDDLAYSEVMTSDRLDLAAMYKAVGIGTGCINHWPQKLDLLAYCIDPNKRMVLTKNAAGELRRAVVRIVERQDEGHVGQPMLILERTYPDEATQEEKQRVIEHMLRRAVDMGIAAGFATEYYWDSSKTGRGIMDMNVVLEDLNRRYNTTSEKLDIKVLNRAGNMPSEYLDSAPTARNMRGQVGARYYAGNKDTVFDNEFVVLEPR